MLKAIASIVLVLVAVMESGCQGSRVVGGAGGSRSTDFIRTSCSTTSYPTLCYSSLSTHAAAINQNPKLLASTALSASLDTAVSTFADMVKLSRTAGMTPREAGSMQDCVEELADSVDQLRRSTAEMDRISGSNFETTMSDVQTWVSAALTDEDTCMDGFDGKAMDGGVKAAVRGKKTAVRRKIVNVAHMTSNALSLINTYATQLRG